MFIIEKEPNSIWAETYKNLRANMKYLTSSDEGESILVTSSDRSEGKTTISSNLSIALAEDGEKVIFIECDLRNPNVGHKFQLKNKEGLTEVLTGKKNLEQVIQKHKSGLHIITAGSTPHNPSEVLGSNIMEDLLIDLKKDYNYIILDSTAIHEFSDAKILSLKSDSVVLVARAEKTLKNSILEAKKELEKIEANILGVVINDIPEAARKYYNLKFAAQNNKNFLLSKLSFKGLGKKNK
ncbi:MAG: CpsD/CapB family tyrosine-protein kinase [Sarcina sp.]